MLSAAAPPRHTAAVVVTLSHKTAYTADEETAFRHIRRYLGTHHIYVIAPPSHDAVYPGFTTQTFPERYFGSARAHGELLLSRTFYRAFLDYEYILICHLDALVLGDRLMEWCAAGYDYIGAPWLLSPDTPHITEQKVGNGGFSLRRVRSFLRVLDSRTYFVDPGQYWAHYAARTPPVQRVLNTPRRLLKRVRAFNDIHWHVRWALRGDVHEDRFWSEYANHYDPAFRIAPVDVAMRFAFEAEPRACAARLGGELPFGAHRWTRYDRQFFEPWLLTSGPASMGRARPREDVNDWNVLQRRLARVRRGNRGR